MKAERVTREVQLLKGQMQLLRSRERYVLFVGGVGSGKTDGAIKKAFALGVENAPCSGIFTEPTHTLLLDVAMPAFRQFFDDNGIPYVERKSPPSFTVKTKIPFEIRLRSTENARLKIGSNVAWAIIDEFGQVSYEAFDGIDKRVRDPRAKLRQTVCAGTPELRVAWPEELFVEKPMPGSEIIRARTQDNVFIDPDYYAKLRARLADDEAKRYLEGEFVPPRGQVYSFFDDDNIVDGSKANGEIVIGADFNVNSMTWVIMRKNGMSFHVVKEHVRDNTNVIDHAAEVASLVVEMFRERGEYLTPHEAASRCVVIPDASGGARSSASPLSIFDHIQRCGFRLRHDASNPPVVDRVFSLNLALKEKRVLIDPSCRQLISCLRRQGYAKDGAPDKTQGFDHGPDALGYPLYFFAPSHHRGLDLKRSRNVV